MVRLATRTGEEGVEAVHSPDRPLALLVHGVTSSSRTWWRVAPALAGRGFRVLAVDLRGHGASARAEGGLALAELIRSDQTGRMRVCAADDCDGLLLDLSRNGSKRFCSVRCGNRVNQQGFRERMSAA